LERHRLIALAIRDGFLNFTGESVLHFAPEKVVTTLVQATHPNKYVTADLRPGAGDLTLNIEQMDLPDASFSRIIASHVLEHVDDAKAIRELRRVLKPGGYAVLMVPLVEGWSETFEDASKTSPTSREIFFGLRDHLRLYGADFRDRIRKGDFELEEYTAGGEQSPEFALMRGEKVFKARALTYRQEK
jgi:SAM-dependent methyltransferase